MSAEIVAFPAKPQPVEAANDSDAGGPPVGSLAWVCLPCTEETGIQHFACYCTPAGVHCWRCHAVQSFS